MKRIMWMLAVAVLVAACASKKVPGPVRVEDRSGAQRSSLASARDPNAKPPGYENEGKPGYYTVKAGDTLIRIGLDTGQNWRDIGRWNQLENPNLLEVGQVLRIVPPVAEHAALARAASAASPAPATTTQQAASQAPAQEAAAPAQAASAPRAAASAPQAPVSQPARAEATATDPSVAWMWPAPGSLLAGFDEAKNKGFDISGKAGDPIFAAAEGRVVYAGAGLRGYGNLLIIKHNDTFLTAYAHNQTLLVREDQSVKKGQKIAEMGNSDADRVKLHFEIRRLGKPVDPAQYLPAR